MRKISKKHWIAFLILFLFEVITLVFAPYIAGYTITFIVFVFVWGSSVFISGNHWRNTDYVSKKYIYR